MNTDGAALVVLQVSRPVDPFRLAASGGVLSMVDDLDPRRLRLAARALITDLLSAGKYQERAIVEPGVEVVVLDGVRVVLVAIEPRTPATKRLVAFLAGAAPASVPLVAACTFHEFQLIKGRTGSVTLHVVEPVDSEGAVS